MTPRARLAGVGAALAASAGALAGSAALTWYLADVPAAGRAPVRVVVPGAELVAGLDAVAVLALAGVAAAVALAGPARRALGGVLALVGAWLGLVVASVRSPSGVEVAALPGAPAGAGVPAAVEPTAAPLLAAAGVLLLVAAGIELLLGEPRLPRFGARSADGPAAPQRPTDPDRAAWEALDAGRDPTAGPA